MNFGNVAFYLYVETMLNMILGYIFWVAVSITLGASSTGESSTAITWSVILSTMSTLGIAVGSQRFLGKAHAQKDSESYSAISQFVLIFTVATLVLGSFVYLSVNMMTDSPFWSSEIMLGLVIISSISYGMTLSFRSVFISSGRTRFLVFVLLASVAVRFASLAISIMLGLGPTGVIVSYVSFYVFSSCVLFYGIRSVFNFSKLTVRILSYKKEIVKASISGWIPSAVSLIGTQSGVLFVFGTIGSAAAGIYFIALSIFTALSSLPMSVLSMAFPVMSGMKQGREVFLWRATKMALFSIMPISSAIAVYPYTVMSLFGKEFETGGLILTVLILSLVPVEINRAVSNLAYAHGSYRQVIMLGSVPNIVRFALYPFVVPLLGGIGTAVCFLVGSIIGLAQAVIISRRENYQFPGTELLLLVGIPLVFGFISYFLIPNALIGSVIIIVGSYAITARLRIVSYDDIEGTIKSIFPYSSNINRKLLTLARVFFH